MPEKKPNIQTVEVWIKGTAPLCVRRFPTHIDVFGYDENGKWGHLHGEQARKIAQEYRAKIAESARMMYEAHKAKGAKHDAA